MGFLSKLFSKKEETEREKKETTEVIKEDTKESLQAEALKKESQDKANLEEKKKERTESSIETTTEEEHKASDNKKEMEKVKLEKKLEDILKDPLKNKSEKELDINEAKEEFRGSPAEFKKALKEAESKVVEDQSPEMASVRNMVNAFNNVGSNKTQQGPDRTPASGLQKAEQEKNSNFKIELPKK